MMLHDGASLEEAKAEFKKHFDNVSTAEIIQMEQALMDEGMPVSAVIKHCDVHAAVFEGSIEDIHIIIGSNDEHNETAWRKRFPSAIRWLYSSKRGNYS